ncbi:5'-3' exoribonuclease 2 [Amphibalanus amphitrite]|uniref:5'-3' exoribonuclease n=1 Tax=Amphibalanus amphitrite TaxID=1232801 RepID=A0A6A4WUY6_AMPAM|nr:5'-3' exoribonuclease 2 [Amphibalanus amphitrite]
MGVPAFFRWLSRKYASVIVDCVQEKPGEVDGVKIPVDISQPNPNGVEFDNLYLDMNGIIHPCTHPEDKPAPKNEDEMMVAIFEAIDKMMSIVRPRKLLYMAIDGTAPRAKMNQQRSRRFRASKETAEKLEEMARIKAELRSKGVELPPDKPKGEHFDSNCITPGTPFMDRLSKCLCFYVHERLNHDAGWKDLKVILSDANVPGEGEHKIMDYIRRQRASPSHDPNTQHVLCGADADLIMLGLATHEPNFTIIREEFKPNQPRPCEICGQIGHEMKECVGNVREKQGEHDEKPLPVVAETQYIFVRLNVLREYLERELEMPNLPFQYDFERAIDDWVFMCFFVGNDFLPHLPSLEIREGAIDRLVNLYKQTVYKTGGFLTNSGRVNLQRVQLIMQDLGQMEDEIFKSRQRRELSFRARNKAQRRQKREADARKHLGGQFAPQAVGGAVKPVENARKESYQIRMEQIAAKSDFKAENNRIIDSSASAGQKRPRDDSDSEEETPDEVRLWEDGFKDRYGTVMAVVYYESKFDVMKDNIEFRHKLAREYVLGLCWVLRYYYQGCASWKWYFPYHYAPFASDFVNIGDMKPQFTLAAPFKPLEQLMSVFPAASRSHVPEPWGELMMDPHSPIIDFYPVDFKIDLNGKKFAWQGVALLPFVSEVRLKAALKSVYHMLTEDEKRRNVRGDDRLFIGSRHPGYAVMQEMYKSNVETVEANPELFGKMSGTLMPAEDLIDQGSDVISPIPLCKSFHNNQVATCRYKDPQFPEGFVFPAKKLPGAISPPRVLKPQDLDAAAKQRWRPQIGMARSNTVASLGAAGHRMVGFHHHRSRSDGSAGYNSVPPLMPGGPPSLMGQGPPGNWQGVYNADMFADSGYIRSEQEAVGAAVAAVAVVEAAEAAGTSGTDGHPTLVGTIATAHMAAAAAVVAVAVAVAVAEGTATVHQEEEGMAHKAEGMAQEAEDTAPRAAGTTPSLATVEAAAAEEEEVSTRVGSDDTERRPTLKQARLGRWSNISAPSSSAGRRTETRGSPGHVD